MYVKLLAGNTMPRRTYEESLETRESILREAVAMTTELGYSGLSLEEVMQ
jgi:AcrR family transcriptional regulator